jgi:hypothetical protein
MHIITPCTPTDCLSSITHAHSLLLSFTWYMSHHRATWHPRKHTYLAAAGSPPQVIA